MTDSDDDSGIHVSKLMPLKDALEAVEGELVRMAFKDGASTYVMHRPEAENKPVRRQQEVPQIREKRTAKRLM